MIDTDKMRAMADIIDWNKEGVKHLRTAYEAGLIDAIHKFRIYLLNRPLDQPGIDLDEMERAVRGPCIEMADSYWESLINRGEQK